MNFRFDKRSVTIYYNDSIVSRLNHRFSCDQIKEIIKSTAIKSLPIMVIIYGMPGSGKTFLAHFLSEQLLHCMIWEKDHVYAVGTDCNIDKTKLRCDDSYINNFYVYVANVFLKTIRCNFITPANNAEQLRILKNYGEGYNKFVIAFDRIDIEDSAENCIHNLNAEHIRKEYDKWKTYQELLETKEI